ncbi:MAG: hypothetical protein VW258_09705 [Thalassolituus sp.]
MTIRLFAGLVSLSLVAAVNADLVALDDQQMQATSGAGLGFALEDFVFNSDSASLSVTGVNDSEGNPVTVNWSELYIMGEGSESGTISTPADIGSYLNPWVIRSVRGSADWDDSSTWHAGDYAAIGDDLGVLEFATSRYNSAYQDTRAYGTSCLMGAAAECSDYAALRRPGIDIGSRFEMILGNGRVDYLDFDFRGVYLDHSHIRLWSREDENGLAELNANAAIIFYAKELDVGVCGTGCDPAISTLNIDDFYLDLNLGYGEIQTLQFSSTSDGNFILELTKPNPAVLNVDTTDSDAMIAFYNEYYDNAPFSHISIGNIQSGADTVGGSIIRGFRAQYFKITSMDL